MKRTQTLRRFGITGRGLVVALPYVWLLLFFVHALLLNSAFQSTTPAQQHAQRPRNVLLTAGHIKSSLGMTFTIVNDLWRARPDLL